MSASTPIEMETTAEERAFIRRVVEAGGAPPTELAKRFLRDFDRLLSSGPAGKPDEAMLRHQLLEMTEAKGHKAGLEAAAKWHEERAALAARGSSARAHEEWCAKAIRSLYPSPAPSGDDAEAVDTGNKIGREAALQMEQDHHMDAYPPSGEGAKSRAWRETSYRLRAEGEASGEREK